MKMSFGLKCALETFQRAMDVSLASARWRIALVYFNDIAVFSKSSEDHFEQVRRALRSLSEAGFTLKLKNSRFLLKLLTTLVTLSNMAAGNSPSIRPT